MALSAPDVPLYFACGATPPAAVLVLAWRARMRRGPSEWWDLLIAGAASVCVLLAVAGWAALAVRGLR